jgi:predicted NACHT family NTPase
MPLGRCEDAEGAHRAGLQGRVESEVEKRLTAGRDVARVQREVEAVGVSNDHRAVRVSARSRRVEAPRRHRRRRDTGRGEREQPGQPRRVALR